MPSKTMILALLGLLLAGCQTARPANTPHATEPVASLPSPGNLKFKVEGATFTLKPITPANAHDVRLLSTLAIPGFARGQLSQCCVTFSPDGTRLSGVCYKSTLPLWNLQTGQPPQSLETEPLQYVAIAFSPAGDQLAAGGFTDHVKLWDPARGKMIRTVGDFQSPVWELAFHPQGGQLAAAVFNPPFSSKVQEESGVQVWDTSQQSLTWKYTGSPDNPLVLSLDVAPDGKKIAGGTFDNVLILAADSGRLIAALPVPDHVGDVAFSPDGRVLAAGSDDHKIRLWKTVKFDVQETLEGHAHYVNGVAFSPGGRLLASGSHDQKVGLWDVQSGRTLAMLDGHQAPVLRVAFHPSGALITSISWDGTIRLWGVSDN